MQQYKQDKLDRRQRAQHSAKECVLASSKVKVLSLLVSTLLLATACFSVTAAIPPSLAMASLSIQPPGSPPLLVGCSQYRHSWPSLLALGCILMRKKVLLSIPSRFQVMLHQQGIQSAHYDSSHCTCACACCERLSASEMRTNSAIA